MRIRYLSDLHLEYVRPKQMCDIFRKLTPAYGSRDICVLAGDIGTPAFTSLGKVGNANYYSLMRFMNDHYRRTFIIPGNHEYYNDDGRDMDATDDHLASYFSEFKNVRLLNNAYETFENHCFVGTTLWSHISNPRYSSGNVKHIPKFDWKECNRRHELSVSFLHDVLNGSSSSTGKPEEAAAEKKCVVITHHVPLLELIDPKYVTPRLLPYHQWYYCNDMSDLVEANREKIACWIYGHTHTRKQARVLGVDFFCNPRGTPEEVAGRAEDEGGDLFRTIVL